MIPLRDSVRGTTFPFVNVLLIVLNLAVFVFELTLTGPQRDTFLYTFAVVPARTMTPPVLSPELITLITSQFLHGGWLHIIGNMLALFIFGDNVEDRLGHLRYGLFYLLCGIAGGLLHIWSDPTSTVPALGASGALAGVLSAYVVKYPTARVTTLVPIFFIPWFVKVPAILWIGGWFALQLLNGIAAISATGAEATGVGYWAHIGGFLAGLILVWPMSRRQRAVPLTASG